MPAPPTFEDDVFISYAHIDNQPLAEGLEGRIETLRERLQIRACGEDFDEVRRRRRLNENPSYGGPRINATG